MEEFLDPLTHEITIPPNIYITVGGKPITLREYFGRTALKEKLYDKNKSFLKDIFARMPRGESASELNTRYIGGVIANLERSAGMAIQESLQFSPLKHAKHIAGIDPNISVYGQHNVKHTVNPFLDKNSVAFTNYGGVARIVSNTIDALQNTMDADGDRATVLMMQRNGLGYAAVQKAPFFQPHVRRLATAAEINKAEQDLLRSLQGFSISQATSETRRDIISGALKNENYSPMALAKMRALPKEVHSKLRSYGAEATQDPHLIGIIKNKMSYREMSLAVELQAKLGKTRGVLDSTVFTPQELAILEKAGIGSGGNYSSADTFIKINLAVRSEKGATGSWEAQALLEKVIKRTTTEEEKRILLDTLRAGAMDALAMKPGRVANLGISNLAGLVSRLSGGDGDVAQNLVNLQLGGAGFGISAHGVGYNSPEVRPATPLAKLSNTEVRNLMDQSYTYKGKSYGLLEFTPVAFDQRTLERLGLNHENNTHVAVTFRGGNGGRIPIGGSNFNDGVHMRTLVLAPIADPNTGRFMEAGGEYHQNLFANLIRKAGGRELKGEGRMWGMAGGIRDKNMRNSQIQEIADAFEISFQEAVRMIGDANPQELNNIMLRYDMITNPKYLNSIINEIDTGASPYGYQTEVAIRGGKAYMTSWATESNARMVAMPLGVHHPDDVSVTRQIAKLNRSMYLAGKGDLAGAHYLPAIEATEHGAVAMLTLGKEGVGAGKAMAKLGRQTREAVGLDSTMILTDLKKGSLAPSPLTREQIARLSPQQVNELIADGRLGIDPLTNELKDQGSEILIASEKIQADVKNIVARHEDRVPRWADTPQYQGQAPERVVNAKTGLATEKYRRLDQDPLGKIASANDKLVISRLAPENQALVKVMKDNQEVADYLLVNMAGLKSQLRRIEAAAAEIDFKTGNTKFQEAIQKIQEAQAELAKVEASGDSVRTKLLYDKVEGMIDQTTRAMVRHSSYTLNSEKVLGISADFQKKFGLNTKVELTSAEIAGARALTDQDSYEGYQNSLFQMQSIKDLFEKVMGNEVGPINNDVFEKMTSFQKQQISASALDILEQARLANLPRATQAASRVGLQEAATQAMARLQTAGDDKVWQATLNVLSHILKP